MVLALGAFLALFSLWKLEQARPTGVEAKTEWVSDTPVTMYLQNGDAPAWVVVAHGFAGSRPLMKPMAWTLARNGYDVVAFDFEGHGANPVPMQGDVNAIEGVTKRLVDQTAKVMDWTGGTPALVGHSMATDVIIHAAEARDSGPVVALSAFSGAVTNQHPQSMLLIAGEWEGRLIEFGRESITQLVPDAAEGELLTVDGVERMALIAPAVEHVGILYSPFALRETVAWLDRYYGVERNEIEVSAIGPWILLLLGSLTLLWWPLSRWLPVTGEAAVVPRPAVLACAAVALAAPFAVYWIDLSVLLPVLVADYLALHLGFTGIAQLLIVRHFRVPMGRVLLLPALGILCWGLGVFGVAIHSFAANFLPNDERLLIVAALALGAVPFMAADAVATQGGRGLLWHRLLLRSAFFASLGLAVWLDFERLFFLILIAPVILLFFLIFGLMGRWTADRAGPLAPGIALGLILAWSLGVTFPLFQA